MMSLLRLFSVASALLALSSGCSTFGVPEHEGEPSDHFDGERFYNPWLNGEQEKIRPGGFLKMAARRLNGDARGPWPEWVSMPPGTKPPREITSGVRITFVGHATLLVQTGGVNLLTDPVWAHRIGPNRVMNIGRFKNPGVRFEDLPEIHAVIVSHNHYDHMDVLTLRRLENRKQSRPPRIFVPLGNAAYLKGLGLRHVEDIDWWQSLEISPGVSIQSVPAQHWSTRMIVDRNHSLWGGYVIDGPSGKIYFAGDTGYGKFVEDIRERVGAVRLALLPIGAYVPSSFRKNHIDPNEAVQIHERLGAEVSIPMHYGTFRLSDEAYDQPVKDLAAALKSRGVNESAFQILKEGQAWEGFTK